MKTNIDMDSIQALAVAHGEMRGQSDEAKINAISSLYNRRTNFNTHWKFRGTWGNMLRQEYCAIRDSESGKNMGYQEAYERLTKGTPFKNKGDEADFVRTMQLWSGIMKGTIKPTETQFYYTEAEERRQRKAFKAGKGGVDFSKLEKVGNFKSNKGEVFTTYKYK